ncbi:MAG TPA: MBL fold metallo-hydrolase [Chloroflexia bacterium]|nr:MBL fold metallo-hydrolase [Chloroflexia bacterium]
MGLNIVNIGYRSTNYYVLVDSVPRLLVDAGWPGTLGMMQHTSSRMGQRLADIPYQLATHFHPDHAGLCQELKGLGLRLIVLDTQLAGIPLLRTYVKPRDSYTDLVLGDNIVLGEDESRDFLERIGIKGEIVSTPGHSDDSVTLVLDEGLAFTGDLTPPGMVPHDLTNVAFQSWEKLRGMGVKIVYPAHGPTYALSDR